MKKILITTILISCIISSYMLPPLSNLYGFKITTINGEEISMQSFSGKKIVFITLPGKKRLDDSTYLKAIDTLKNLYSPQPIIIAFPLLEDGNNANNQDSLNAWYRSFISSDIYISRSINAEKSSYAQDTLFNWLTYQEKNGHFNQDVKGIGQIFLINEQGELRAVAMPVFGFPIQNIRTVFSIVASNGIH